eukprot:Sspe_Gene.97467::Locus_71045_Transcript_1_1_Confidence_1.000_Length_1665::g.97467::m.97467
MQGNRTQSTPTQAAHDTPEGYMQGTPAPTALQRFAESYVGTWVVENAIFVTVLTIRFMLPAAGRDDMVSMFLLDFIGGLICVEGSIMLQALVANTVFAHIPYFNSRARDNGQGTVPYMLKDWFVCNLPANLLATLLSLNEISRLDREQYEEYLRFRVEPVLLVKLLVCTIVADVVFYLNHRLLHTQLLYPLHRTHHEHKACTHGTNYHFGFLDLLIEGFLPIFVAFKILVDVFGMPVCEVDQIVIFTYYIGHEIATHAGKPLPYPTTFAPLSVLYRPLYDVDSNAVRHHESHHALVTCNYGLSSWCDRLLGTYRLKYYDWETKPTGAAAVKAKGE